MKNKTTLQIFKLQLSIVPPGNLLVYNEDQSIMQETVASREVTRFIKTDKHSSNQELKAYCYGYIAADGMLEITDRAPPQNW